MHHIGVARIEAQGVIGIADRGIVLAQAGRGGGHAFQHFGIAVVAGHRAIRRERGGPVAFCHGRLRPGRAGVGCGQLR